MRWLRGWPQIWFLELFMLLFMVHVKIKAFWAAYFQQNATMAIRIFRFSLSMLPIWIMARMEDKKMGNRWPWVTSGRIKRCQTILNFKIWHLLETFFRKLQAKFHGKIFEKYLFEGTIKTFYKVQQLFFRNYQIELLVSHKVQWLKFRPFVSLMKILISSLKQLILKFLACFNCRNSDRLT